MKIGSLYQIHNESAIGRCVGEYGTCEMLTVDTVTGKFSFNQAPEKYKSGNCMSQTMWTMFPTVLPERCKFLGMVGASSCLIRRFGGIIDVVSFSIVRTVNYVSCEAVCKTATICWLIVSKQLRLSKDMRRLIGEYIWESRESVEWEELF